jgi:hypothetical protein
MKTLLEIANLTKLNQTPKSLADYGWCDEVELDTPNDLEKLIEAGYIVKYDFIESISSLSLTPMGVIKIEEIK